MKIINKIICLVALSGAMSLGIGLRDLVDCAAIICSPYTRMFAPRLSDIEMDIIVRHCDYLEQINSPYLPEITRFCALMMRLPTPEDPFAVDLATIESIRDSHRVCLGLSRKLHIESVGYKCASIALELLGELLGIEIGGDEMRENSYESYNSHLVFFRLQNVTGNLLQ